MLALTGLGWKIWFNVLDSENNPDTLIIDSSWQDTTFWVLGEGGSVHTIEVWNYFKWRSRFVKSLLTSSSFCPLSTYMSEIKKKKLLKQESWWAMLEANSCLTFFHTNISVENVFRFHVWGQMKISVMNVHNYPCARPYWDVSVLVTVLLIGRLLCAASSTNNINNSSKEETDVSFFCSPLLFKVCLAVVVFQSFVIQTQPENFTTPEIWQVWGEMEPKDPILTRNAMKMHFFVEMISRFRILQ